MFDYRNNHLYVKAGNPRPFLARYGNEYGIAWKIEEGRNWLVDGQPIKNYPRVEILMENHKTRRLGWFAMRGRRSEWIVPTASELNLYMSLLN